MLSHQVARSNQHLLVYLNFRETPISRQFQSKDFHRYKPSSDQSSFGQPLGPNFCLVGIVPSGFHGLQNLSQQNLYLSPIWGRSVQSVPASAFPMRCRESSIIQGLSTSETIEVSDNSPAIAIAGRISRRRLKQIWPQLGLKVLLCF